MEPRTVTTGAMSGPAKTRDEEDIDKLAEVVLGIRQHLQGDGLLPVALTATFINDAGMRVTTTDLAGLAGRRC